MKAHSTILIVLLLVFTACSRNGQDEWADIDYNKIAHENYQRDNDSSYVAPPSVIGCVDDDLYNCKVRRY